MLSPLKHRWELDEDSVLCPWFRGWCALNPDCSRKIAIYASPASLENGITQHRHGSCQLKFLLKQWKPSAGSPHPHRNKQHWAYHTTRKGDRMLCSFQIPRPLFYTDCSCISEGGIKAFLRTFFRSFTFFAVWRSLSPLPPRAPSDCDD